MRDELVKRAGGRVLVIEDEQGIRDWMQSELAGEGYEVVTAPDGLAGVSLVTGGLFDVVISDITMPGLNGVEALRRIRQFDSDLQVIMVTGYGTIDVAVECMKLGAFDFVQKPFEVEELLTMTRRALDARRLNVTNSLFRATQTVLACRQPREIARTVLNLAATRFDVASAAFVLPGPDGRPDVETWPAGEAAVAARALAVVTDAPADAAESISEVTIDETTWSVRPLVLDTTWLGALVLARPAARGGMHAAEVEWFNVLASQTALALENATLVGRLNDQLDEQRRLQDQLVQTEKMAALGRMAAGIVHDMVTPLTSVCYGIDNLRELEVSDRLARVIDRMNKAAEQLRHMVENLKRFARQESQNEAKHATSLTDVAKTAMELSEQATARCTIALHGAQDDVVPGHASQLTQVLVNLIINAARHVTDTGRIDVRVVPAVDEVAVEVQDDGCGMTREVRERLFEPFFTTNGPSVGTGLGLWISREIVRQHGGTIDVESEVGRGTTMRVRLSRRARRPWDATLPPALAAKA